MFEALADVIPPEDAGVEAVPPPPDVTGSVWPELGELAPGPETVARLARLPLSELDEYDLVEAVAAWEKLAAFAHARQVAAMAELTRRPMFADLSGRRGGIEPTKAVALEVAARLRVSVREAQRRVDLAEELAEDRPATLAALQAGEIDYWRARSIVDGVRVLDGETARRVEAQVLPEASGLARSALRDRVERAVLAADPAASEQRRERATADRQVRCRPEADGMGSTWALLPAHDTWVLDRVLDAAADGLARDCPGDDRTHEQRRADALAAMAHTAWSTGWIGGCPRCDHAGDTTSTPAASGAAATGALDTDRAEHRDHASSGAGGAVRLSGRGRRMEVGVLVPYSTLIGLDERPGELAGYGPIPAEVARRIAAEGTWRRILTDPATGIVLDYGTTRYTPPPELATHVMLRDQTCRGVACTRPASECDLDHTIPAPDGPTSAANLCPLCRRHHNGKTCAGWRLVQPQPGHLVWRSPTGHRYERPPEQVGPIIQPSAPTDAPDRRPRPRHTDDPAASGGAVDSMRSSEGPLMISFPHLEADVRSISAWRGLAVPHAHPEYFSGPVVVHELAGGAEPTELEILAVFFDAGARTLPHVHSTEQLLYFLDGEGVVGTREMRRIYRAGGMAVIPAGEWHWHGATPTSPMGHLSIRPGGPSTWPPEVELGDWESYLEGVEAG